MKKLSELTPDEKWIIVAEFDGWKWWKHTKSKTFIFCHPSRNKQSLDDDAMSWDVVERPIEVPHFVSLAGVPDYPNDQNAIIAACGKLDGLQKEVWAGKLADMLEDLNKPETTAAECAFLMSNATASQRTDALILTIGKAAL